MLKPSVQVYEHEGILIAEFWDCWRLDPAPVQDLHLDIKHIAARMAVRSWCSISAE